MQLIHYFAIGQLMIIMIIFVQLMHTTLCLQGTNYKLGTMKEEI